MKWPMIDQIRSFTVLPSGYTWDYLKREEIDVAIIFFQTWFPSITVGLGSPFLNQQFYEDNVVLEDDLERAMFAIVVRRNHEIVAIATWEKIDGADVIFGRVGAVAKHHRQTKLAVAAQDLGEKNGKVHGSGLDLWYGDNQRSVYATSTGACGLQSRRNNAWLRPRGNRARNRSQGLRSHLRKTTRPQLKFSDSFSTQPHTDRRSALCRNISRNNQG